MEAKPTITNILAQANGGLMINATSDNPNMEVSAFILCLSVLILILYCHWSYRKVKLTCPCRILFLQQLMVSVTSPSLLIPPFLCLSDLSYSQPFSRTPMLSPMLSPMPTPMLSPMPTPMLPPMSNIQKTPSGRLIPTPKTKTG